MKTSIVRLTLLALSALFASSIASVSANPQGDQRCAKCKEHKKKLVYITGSHIPVRESDVKPLPNTANPVRIYSRREMDRSGSTTVAEFLARDPSITISGR